MRVHPKKSLHPSAETVEVIQKPTQEELVEKDKEFIFEVGAKGKPGDRKIPEVKSGEEVKPEEVTVVEIPQECPRKSLFLSPIQSNT